MTTLRTWGSLLAATLLIGEDALASPWCGTPERVRARAEGRSAPAPRPTACVAPQDLADAEGYAGTFDQTHETAAFLLAWDAADPVVDASVAAHWGDLLEAAWTSQVDEGGWLPPDRTDVCPITVLLVDFPQSASGTGGYTNTEGDGDVPYIVLNTDWAEYGDDWMATLTAHEFHHAVQFAYGAFWDVEDWWYWEATAEWIPDLLHDDANTYTWSLWSYYDAPHLALHSQVEHAAYGHFVFDTFLEEAHGADTPRAIWEAGRDGGSVGDAIGAIGHDFDALTMAWASRMAAFDVDEADVWRAAMAEFEVDPYAADVSEYPASGEAPAGRAPQERGQNFLRFAGPGPVVFTFDGDPRVGGADARWALGVATVAEDGTVTHEVVHADAAGAASVTLGGAGVAEVLVAVVPLGPIGEQGATYSWHAARIDGSDEAETVACGCASGGAASFAPALAALVAARRRRRPRRRPVRPIRPTG